ncbi:hypothetical protein PHLCEN_2v11285 [Hermanssonia centrifuga]|uniref:Uncharacterized protein n=1 Tax=Hermanssonia centrifuga TaxID=98765 RepID=A0A2R6NKT3_9APHY|nr:hypothetical protein PHLCEN_2v11285 [Hermanssonia centrifuga]
MAALNPILVSRFLLNLQQVEGGEINNTNTSSMATFRDLWLFVTMSRLGDLGGDLDHGPEPEEVEILMEEFDVRDVSEEASRDEEAARVVDIRLEIVPQALPVEENPFEEFVVGSSRDIQEVPRFGHGMTQEIS